MNYQDASTHALTDDTTSVATSTHTHTHTLSVSKKILSIFGRVFKSKPANR